MNRIVSTTTLVILILLPHALKPADLVLIEAVEREKKADTLFPHIPAADKRLHYFAILESIRNNEKIHSLLLGRYRNSHDFYFHATTKRWFENGTWFEGVNVQIPFWVEAITRKSWGTLKQLLARYPHIVSEAYVDDPFCKIVAQAEPPADIVKEIIEIAATLSPEKNPFLEPEKDPNLFACAWLHPQTPEPAKILFLDASHKAALAHPSITAGESNCKENYCNSFSFLCAQELASNSQSPLLNAPLFNEWKYAKAVLFHLINEQKYQGFDRYFAFLRAHNFCFDGYACFTNAGLKHFAKMGSEDVTYEATTFLLAALKHCPDQELPSLFDFIVFLKDEHQSDKEINPSTLSAQTVLAVIEKQTLRIEHAIKHELKTKGIV